jgi:hypothetical protein
MIIVDRGLATALHRNARLGCALNGPAINPRPERFGGYRNKEPASESLTQKYLSVFD